MPRRTHPAVVDDELWSIIPEFPLYQVSSLGDIRSMATGRAVRTSVNNHGHVKVKLSENRRSATRSVAVLVAEAFVEVPKVDVEYSGYCDSVIILDGDFTNVRAWNLAWRPKHFAWKYTHQMNADQSGYIFNLPVENVKTGTVYPSIHEAATTEGLLYDDIWRSTFTGSPVFPDQSRWLIVERV